MNFIMLRVLASTTLLISGASLSAQPSSNATSQDDHADHAEHTDHSQHSGPGEGAVREPSKPAPQASEEERVCRSVKLDMSSRRKTKVCKTADEWREFNQRR